MFSDFLSNLLMVVCALEGLVCVVLCLPFGGQQKQRFVEWTDKQAWLSPLRHVASSVFLLLCIMLYGFYRDASGLMQQASRAGGNVSVAHVERLVRAEINGCLSAVALLLIALLHRVYATMVENNRLRSNNTALERQARGAGEAMSRMLDSDAATKSAVSGAVTARAEREIGAMRAQLDELRAENSSLRSMLRDYDAVMPGSRKKYA